MPLIYACIAPHAGDLIPETVGDINRIRNTRESMQEMGAALEALAPEVLVIVNPHGFRLQNAMSISVAERATADWSPEVKLDFDMDVELAHSIADKAGQARIPIGCYIYGASSGPDCYIPLDWGAAVPLYFLGGRFQAKPHIVHISPMRLLPDQMHYDFGRSIGQTLRQSEKRIAFIASADQGHTHSPEGPYGFDPAAAQYDAWMQGVIRSGQLNDLLAADAVLVENGKPDSLWPTLVLAGVLEENPLRARLLSYEVNGYFGILCAEFRGEPAV